MMLQVVICLSLLIFVLIMLLFYNAARHHDDKNKRINSIIDIDRAVFDEDMEKPFFERIILPILKSIIRFLSNLMPKRKGDKSEKIEKSLKYAGLKLDVNEYNAAKLIFSGGCAAIVIIILLILGLSVAVAVLITILFLVFSVIAPIYFLKFRTKKRQTEIMNQLPDVIDLLCISIEAGLNFDSALGKINERLSGILVDELNSVLTEIQLGKPRKNALKNMIERSTVEELNNFISAVLQSEQLGIPIKNVLHTQSQQLRRSRRQRAEEQAMKAPVKMIIPLVVFVFPVLFIILLGPTVINVMDQFG